MLSCGSTISGSPSAAKNATARVLEVKTYWNTIFLVSHAFLLVDLCARQLERTLVVLRQTQRELDFIHFCQPDPFGSGWQKLIDEETT